MRSSLWLLGLGLILAAALSYTAVSATQATTSLEPLSIALSGPDFAAGTSSGAKVTPAGVQSGPTGGTYTSPARQVPQFSDVLVNWRAEQPLSSTLSVAIRTSSDGQKWTNWTHVEPNDDLVDERDPANLTWGAPLFAGQAQWWQVQVEFTAAPDGAAPTLQQLNVSTVDVGTHQQVKPTPARPDTTSSIAKPPVVTRTQWGSPDGQGSRVPPAYYAVNHMVVHHTVDPNTLGAGESWWGDRVLAIWSFHTYTRGWGDIGYNFLVAPNGTIFEGRAGGDNAVGFHDTGNYGSMGVAMIGTYAAVAPSSSAQSSLVDLLAWKASQRNIDPLGSSYYYGCDISRYCGNAGAITPNIAGHRQVANNPPGYTSCPGDTLYDVLPTIRARVQSRLSGVADNGDLTIDDLESSFTRSNANWYEAGCGDGGHIFYTFATDNPDDSTNSGIWRKEGLSAGNYRIYVHIPQNCGAVNATESAHYTVWQNGAKIAEKTISQNTTTEWIEITPGPIAMADLPVEVHLTDLTGEPLSSSRQVIFDTVRWVKEIEQTNLAVESVSYDRTMLSGGQLLGITFRVRNTGTTIIHTQAPTASSTTSPLDGYTYDEGECFAGNSSASYPAFPKESGRIRVMLGGDGLGADCQANTGGYPWRWGLGDDLAPGEVRDIIGYVRFRNLGPDTRTVTLRAGAINEYVSYLAQDQGVQTITILPEADAPVSLSYTGWQPEAQVFALGAVPDDFLARTANPLSIPSGTFLGNMAWDGTRIDWGTDGPFGQSDMFLVRQTRSFYVPADGTYQFQITSDDGSWLWIDGQLVAEAHGLHEERTATGSIWLNAGEHVLSFKYFERSSQAVMSYSWMPPGATAWSMIPVRVGGGAAYVNGYFGPTMTLTIAADDHGGAGISRIRWRLNGGSWSETPGNRMAITPGGGSFTLEYQAIDNANNTEMLHQVQIQVDGSAPQSVLSPSLEASGMIRLTLSGSDLGSGIALYEVSVHDVTAATPWQVWQTSASTNLGFFGQPDHSYEFRVRAVDRLGNWEATHSFIDGFITVPSATSFQHVYLPNVVR